MDENTIRRLCNDSNIYPEDLFNELSKHIDGSSPITARVAIALASIRAGQPLSRVSELLPSLSEAPAFRHYTLGCAQLSRPHLFDLAESSFNRALAADPHFAWAQLGLAISYRHRRMHERASRHYRAALRELGSRDTPLQARLGLGLCALELGQTAQAEKIFWRSLALFEDSVEAALAVVYVLLKRREVALAAKVLTEMQKQILSKTTKYITDDPEKKTKVQLLVRGRFADLSFFLSLRLDGDARQKRLVALNGLISSLELDPPYESLLRGRIAQHDGNMEEAKQLLADATNTENEETAVGRVARLHYAELLCRQNELEEAGKIVEELLVKSPNDERLLRLSVAIHASCGKHGVARVRSKILAEVAVPDDPVAWELFAWASRLIPKDVTSTSRRWAALTASSTEGPETKIRDVSRRLQYNSAVLEGKDAIVESLAQEFRRENLGNDLAFDFNRAVLLEQKDPKEAEQAYTILLTQYPYCRQVYIRLAVLNTVMKEPQKAMRWVFVASRLWPDEPEVVYATLALASLNGLTRFLLSALDRVKNHPSLSLDCDVLRGALLLQDAQRSRTAGSVKAYAALTLFLRALKASPSHVVAAHGIACTSAFRGDALNASHLLKQLTLLSLNAREMLSLSARRNMLRAVARAGGWHEAIAFHAQLSSRIHSFQSIEQAKHLGCILALSHARLQDWTQMHATLKKLGESYEHDATVSAVRCQLMRFQVLNRILEVGDTLSEAEEKYLMTLLREAHRLTRYARAVKSPKNALSVIDETSIFCRKLPNVFRKLVRNAQSERELLGRSHAKWNQGVEETREMKRREGAQLAKETEAQRKARMQRMEQVEQNQKKLMQAMATTITPIETDEAMDFMEAN